MQPHGSPAAAVLDREIKKQRTPSVQYVFFSDVELIYKYQNGWADITRSLRVDDNTTFNAYSLTKTVTALAILQLAANGKLQLDDPVHQHLPSLNIAENITIRHLLTHTSGIGNPMPLRWTHLSEEHKDYDYDAFFTNIIKSNDLLHAKPGAKFRYSNIGYMILGKLVEKLSGLSYTQYVTQNIIHNLGLNSDQLGFTIPHKILHATGYHPKYSISNLLLGFLIDRNKMMLHSMGRWSSFKPHYVNGVAYGGLIGTVNGFVTFAQQLLKKETDLLANEYRQLYFAEAALGNGSKTGMALSWFTGTLSDNRYLMHAGGGGGYYCELRLYPHIRRGSFIVFNRTGFTNERFADKVDKFFIGK
jgi:CubicO group peptidase (beta-lactamase class C family)